MEEKPTGNNKDIELIKQYQAAIEMEEGEAEEYEYDEEMTEEETKMYEEINLDNFKNYIADATKLKIAKNYDKACLILKIVIQKLTALYNGDSLCSLLALPYYLMGDTILEKVENNTDVFGGTANESVKEEMAENDGSNKPSNKNLPQVDDDDIQASWENLDVSRLILQRRIESENLGEETKMKLRKQLALIHNKLGSCLTWMEEFGRAVEELQSCLALQEQVMNANRSRKVAETLYIIGNTMSYMDDKQKEQFELPPIHYFQRAARIFENLIKDQYEKKGIPLENVKADSKGIKKALALVNRDDDGNTSELKNVLKSIYQKIIDSFTESEVKKLLAKEKKVEETIKPTGFGIDAFGQPTSGNPGKIKHLGTYGSKNSKNENKGEDKNLGKRNRPEDDDEEQDNVEKKLKTD